MALLVLLDGDGDSYLVGSYKRNANSDLNSNFIPMGDC